MAGSAEAWRVGYGFNPTDEQLVGHFLKKKLKGELEADCAIPVLDIYNWEPAELFALYDLLSSVPSGGREYFFLSPGGRKRKTPRGFWKGTGGKRVVQARDTAKPIGIKRYLVYHEGRQPKGHRSNVAMHKYHLNPDTSDSEISDPTAWVLCRIINRKSKKAKPATVSASSDLSGQSNLNSAQATLGVTIESDCPIEMSSTGFQDQNMPTPTPNLQLPTCNEQQSCYDDNWHVDVSSDGTYYMPYSLSDGISLVDLLNFDDGTRQTQTCEEQCWACDDNRYVDGSRDGRCDMPYSLSDGIGLEDLRSSDQSED